MAWCLPRIAGHLSPLARTKRMQAVLQLCSEEPSEETNPSMAYPCILLQAFIRNEDQPLADQSHRHGGNAPSSAAGRTEQCALHGVAEQSSLVSSRC